MLTQLATQLETCDRIAISTLTGMGGIGKSELALQYAQQEYKKNTYLGGITWLNVADSDVGTSILSFAQFHLGLTLPTKGTLEERVRFCWQNWFRNKQDESLIIFDDVREYKQIKAYLPPQSEKRFKVIITTRNNNLSATIQTLQLPILGEDAALDLLRSYVEDGRIDQELDAAKSLCRDLGYLPLALELVARLLRRRNKWSVEDIRRRLSEKRLSLQRYENFDQEMTAERGVEAAFDLTWENLDENSRLLAMYLSLFALAPVSKSLIDDLLGEQDPDDIEEWLADNLVNLNLVNDLGNNWYELHTLIRVYLREKLEESAFKEEAKRAYCKVMVDIAKDVNQTLTLADVSRLKPYIDHLKIAVDELNEWLGEENLIWPFIGLGRFYEGQGFYDQAAPYLEQCLIVSQKRLGENHPSVASSLNNLAALYENQGRYTEAEPLYIRALSIYQQQLGENHPLVVTILKNLAGLYQAQGRDGDAASILQRAQSIQERLLKSNDS
ncbi:MAG: tetratricopeptide repeat protein [Dolichospermum sp.]